MGNADLSKPGRIITEQYASLIDIYPRAISIGITLPHIITEEILLKNSTMIYNEINSKLNNITSHLCDLLENQSYKALSIPKSGTINNGIFTSLHNLAASTANLGRIEKNMLVTPEVGIGVDWGTILTNAPLEVIKL